MPRCGVPIACSSIYSSPKDAAVIAQQNNTPGVLVNASFRLNAKEDVMFVAPVVRHCAAELPTAAIIPSE